jgi:putative tricarboxylic transport membrane protein
MPEHAGGSPDGPKGKFEIANPRDFYGGLATAGFALWATSELPGMRGFAFGPGTAPRLFAGVLLVLSLAVALMGLFTPGEARESYAIRGPLIVTASILLFAVTIRSAGLVVASFLSIVVSAAATKEVRWLETIIWAAVLTVFCVLLFHYGLNQPLQIWPSGFDLTSYYSQR